MSVHLRIAAIICCIALVALNALLLVPETSDFYTYYAGASVALAAALLVIMFAIRGKPRPEPEPKPAKGEMATPMPVPAASNQAEAEIVSFLATLQERGRLVDFLMEDISTYVDAQVGAAARVVHEGCKVALREQLEIRSVRDDSEGSVITIPAGYAADEYRLIGNIRGAGPFSGTLVHRGWKTERVKLPRILRADEDRLPTIAPAEVELK